MTAVIDYRLNDNLISPFNPEESNPMNTEYCTLLHDSTVARANALVTQTGILDTFDRWRTEDGTIRRGGLISERAVLVGLMLLAGEQSPLSLTLLAELLHRRLASPSRQLLDLPTPGGSESTEATKSWLSRTQAAFHRMLALMDPYPRSNSARNFREISGLVNDRDVAMESRMRTRLQEFSEAFILTTVAQQPPRLRDANPSIDLAIDQFFTPAPMVNGFSRRNLDRHVAEEAASGRTSVPFRPVDVSAGWHRPDEADASESSGNLLTVMDGFTNDVEKVHRGLHARSAEEVQSYDTAVGHHLGLTSTQASFRRGFSLRIDDEHFDLSRNGILHGNLTNYDNVIVASAVRTQEVRRSVECIIGRGWLTGRPRHSLIHERGSAVP